MPTATSPSTNSPAPMPENKKSPAKLVVVLLVVGLLVYGVLYALVFNKKTDTKMSPSQTNTAKSTELGYDPEETVTVTLTDNGFSPQAVTIKPGQSITWVNNSGKTATVDSSPHPQHTDFPFLNLGEFEDGESKTLVFPEAGKFRYHDHLDSSSFGTITVE